MTRKIGETKRRMQNYRPNNEEEIMEIGTAERLTAAASYDLLRRLTEKGVISKERFAKLCSLLRQYNQGTMLPLAENLSDYIVSSFEIR